ncbi:MAG: tetratricopeptide repeat protein [Pedobacter sp.]|nr:tetratricopeptide repeat protein [Pedobacter sp.]
MCNHKQITWLTGFFLRNIILLVILIFPGTIVHAEVSPLSALKSAIQLSLSYPDSAFLIIRNIHHKATAENDQKVAGMCLQQMGKICYNQAHYAQALEYHQQAEKIYRSLNDKRSLADNFNDMGTVYYQNIDKKSSKKQFDQALRIFKEINNNKGLAETYGNIGHLYEKQQRYDSSFYYQRRALAEYLKADDKGGIAKIYENLGSIHEDLVRYDSSRYYFDRSLALYNISGNQVSSIEVVNNIGDILRKTGNYQEGLTYSKKALKMSLDTKNEYQEASAYRDIARAYNLMNRNDSAFYYMELSRKHLLHIYSDQNNRQMSFLQILYSVDKKNDEIAALENNRKVNIIITVAAVIVIILLVVLGLLTISRQRLKLSEGKAVAETNHQLNEAQRAQLELKSKELTSHTLQVIQHNQFLDTMRERLIELVNDDKRDNKRQLQQVIQQINQNINHDQQWKEFTTVFEQLHQSFFDNVKSHFVDLTINDIRLIALLKMNMSSKDMAAIFGISQDSLRVARYRLRKKLKIDTGENLTTFIQSI